MKKSILTILVSLFTAVLILTMTTPATGQQITVTGSVKDASGTALAGVSVTAAGNNQAGTATDQNGEFRLAAPPAATLIFSMVGYQEQQVELNGRSSVNIVLQLSTSGLDEVVVVGYGTTKKVNLTGAVATVSGEDLLKRQVGQTSMALQGVAPGVTVTQSTGQPGADGGTIRIRGIGTLNNSAPLILVDGVVMSMDHIDVSSIESISVLKDAASASIYGSRAANGVILITTKRGKKGKFGLTYDAYVGKQKPTNVPEMVNGLDHMNLINEAHTNVGRSPLFSQEYIDNYVANKTTNPDLYPDTDWQSEVMTGSGLQTNHAIGITGGTDKIQFFGSFGYLNQQGLIDNVNYQRYFFRLNTNIQITDKLSGSFDIFVRNNTRNSIAEFPGDVAAAIPATGMGLIWGLMNKLPATQAARYSNGSWAEGQNGANPVAIIKEGGQWKQTSTPIAGNFALTYKPLKSVTARVAFSPTYSQPQTSSFVNVVKTYDPNGTLRFTVPAVNTLNESIANERSDQLDATINFAKTYGDHDFSALAGYQYINSRYRGFDAFRDNFLFPEYPILSAGSSNNMKNGGYATEWALISYFGRINYAFSGKYLFEANVRHDGSSRFATGNKWGTFPSFSAGWRISEEPFMAFSSSVVDEMKVRLSWGELGNQDIGSDYPFAPTVSLDPRYISNGLIQNGAAIMSLANTNISWETTKMTNVGLDLRLMKNLGITFDYYYKRTTGILLQLSIPRTMGVGAPFQNAGVVDNKGWDLQIDYSNYARPFKYGATVVLSDVRNKIVDLKGIQQTGTIVNREGFPINSLYLLSSMGLLDAKDFGGNGEYLHTPQQFGLLGPGDIRYEDTDGNNLVNNDDRRVLGNTIPRLTFSLNLNLAYKNFDFLAFLQGVGKVDGYLTGSAITPFLLGGTAYEYQKNRWTADNPDANAVFPRFAFGENNNYQHSDFWLRSASYLRVKNIQVGYTLPKTLLNRLRIQNLRVYLSGENMFTLTGFWPGWDPEIAAGSIGAYYPQVKTYNLGLNLKF